MDDRQISDIAVIISGSLLAVLLAMIALHLDNMPAAFAALASAMLAWASNASAVYGREQACFYFALCSMGTWLGGLALVLFP